MKLTKMNIGLGLATIAAPVLAVVYGANNVQRLSISSRYLVEKGYSKCAQRCADIESGYKWAKEQNMCNALYDSGRSTDFNLGVVARAWDDCAYSDDGSPI